jgi:hypothetical protein
MSGTADGLGGIAGSGHIRAFSGALTCAFLLFRIVMNLRTTLAMFVAVVAATAASGCGPADHASGVRVAAGDGGASVATSAPSTPVAAATPHAKPRPVAPKPVPKPVPPKPAPKPIPKPAAAKPVARSTCGAPANPWGYNFCGRGSYIHSPADGVCGYFDCIASFGDGVGYMVQCNDGMYSMSGGRSGACSHHSGEGRAVYSGP